MSVRFRDENVHREAIALVHAGDNKAIRVKYERWISQRWN